MLLEDKLKVYYMVRDGRLFCSFGVNENAVCYVLKNEAAVCNSGLIEGL